MSGLNIVSTTGGGGTYDSAEVTSFDGVLLTNSGGNQIDSLSTVDIYKVTV
jgi:queuine/archaeosine tRNA-ribosyltransferase